MKILRKICALVIIGILVGVNFTIVTHTMFSDFGEEHQSVIVEDRTGNTNGYHSLEKREDGKYDLEIWAMDSTAHIEIFGLVERPEELLVRIDRATDDSAVECVIYMDSIDMEKAIVTLPRFASVYRVLQCENFDPVFFKSDEWEDTKIQFIEGESTVTFEVEHFSAYGVYEVQNRFTVTTTEDTGEGSLRQAIQNSNENFGLDLIDFDIPKDDTNHYYYEDDGIAGHVTFEARKTTESSSDSWIHDIDSDYPHSFWSITPSSALPIVTDPVIIDGYTQTGAQENSLTHGNNAILTIELDGINAGLPPGGLHIAAGNSVVRGLAISRFGLCGIQIDSFGNNVIEGNYIGTDISGTEETGNFIGINIFDSPRNRVGGEDITSANLILGNELLGVFISGDGAFDNVVLGNYIGTPRSSSDGLAKIASGVWMPESLATKNQVEQNHDIEELNMPIIFLDTSVDDYVSLMKGILFGGDSDSTSFRSGSDVVLLDTNRDGIEQITEELAKYTDVTSIHILSHGSSGSMTLGNSILTNDNIDSYSEQISSWRDALTDNADILLYGCELAKDDQGTEFIEKIGKLTGCDIAASDDSTGSSQLGGDWDLEVNVGTIETSLPFTQMAIEDYDHLLGEDIIVDDSLANYIADPIVTYYAKQALVNGLYELSVVLGDISTSSDLTSQFMEAVPGLLESGVDPNAPGFGDIIDGMTLGDLFNDKFKYEIDNYFSSGSSLDDLAYFIENLSTSENNLNITVEVIDWDLTPISGDEYEMWLTIHWEVIENKTYHFDLGRNADVLGLSYDYEQMPSVLLQIGFEMDLTFGTVLNLTEGNFSLSWDYDDTKVIADDEDFFIRDTTLTAVADVDASGLNYDLQIGFLEIMVEDGEYILDADAIALFVDPNNGDTRNRINYTELTTTSIGDLVNISTSHSISALQPVEVVDIAGIGFNSTFSGLTLNFTLYGDPFDPYIAPSGENDPRTALPIRMSDDFIAHLVPFNTILSDGVLGLLEQLKGWFGAFGASQLFSVVGVPFADGESLASVLDFFSGIDGLITDPYMTLTDDDGITSPLFKSVQELAGALANALGVSLGIINPHYNKDRHELTFNINLDPSLPSILEIPIDFNLDLGVLGSIQTNVEVSLEPSINFTMVVGFDLRMDREIVINSGLTDFALKAALNPENGSVFTPSNGQLPYDAKFKLSLGSLGTIHVNVSAVNTSGNSDLNDLVADIQLAINISIAAQNIDAIVDVELVTGDRLCFSSPNITFMKIQNNSVDANESAGGFELLGFWDNQQASTSPTPINGIISGAATFNIMLGTNLYSINIDPDTDNANISDPTDSLQMINGLVSNIRTEIDSEVGADKIEVEQVGSGFKLYLGTTTERFLRLLNPNEIALKELGIPEDQIAAELMIVGDRSLIAEGNALSASILANGNISTDAIIQLEVDGDPVEVTVRAANGKIIGFVCNQFATGTLTAQNELEDMYGHAPGQDITFKLTIEDESYVIHIPKSQTTGNGHINHLISDINTALVTATAENGTTVDISSIVNADKDGSGKKLTFIPANISHWIRISSMGDTQDNGDMLDLATDLNEALGYVTLSDGTPLDRIMVAGIIGNDTNNNGTDDEFYMALAIPSAPKDWLNVTGVSGANLGFFITDVNVFGPRSNGQLGGNAQFTLTINEGTGPESFTVTVMASSTNTNSEIRDLVDDINIALQSVTPQGGGSANISGKIVAGLLTNRITLSATNSSAKLLKVTGTNSIAHNQIGLDDGVTARTREKRGRLFIRNTSIEAALNLIVNTTDIPALSANFGFVGIEIGTINGTLDPGLYGDNVGVHGGISVGWGGITSTFDLPTSIVLSSDARFKIEFEDLQAEEIVITQGPIGSINTLKNTIQTEIDLVLTPYGANGKVVVGVSGKRLTMTTPGGERLRLVIDDSSNPAATEIGFASGQQTGSFYLSDLTNIVTDFSLLNLNVDLGISGSGNITLTDFDIPMSSFISGLLDELGFNPRIVITLEDFTNLSTINVTGLDLGAIADGFDDLNFSSILSALRSVYNFLTNFSKYDFYDEPIPILGVTLNETLNFIEPFLLAIEELSSENASIVQELTTLLKQVLGLPTEGDSVILSVLKGSTILRFNITWNTSYSASLPIQIDLLNLLEITMPLGLEDLVNLSGAAGLEAEFSAEVTLGFGIDLSNLTIYIYDNTGVRLEGYANASNVNFIASLGPFGLFITGGHVVFNEDGNPSNTNPAFLTLTAFDDPNPSTDGDKIELFNLSAYNLKANLSAGLGAILPCYFPTASNFIGNLDFNANISMAVGTSDPFDIKVNASLNSAPDFTKLPDFGNFSLIDSLLLAVEGLDMLLALLENVLSGRLGEIELPLVGGTLADGAEFIEDIRDRIIPKLRDFIENAPQKAIGLIQEAIFNALGPPGLNILQLDPGWDNVTGLSYHDVQYKFPDNATELQFNLWLGDQYTYITPEIDFGLPGLGLEMDGGINITFDWNLLLVFGISLDDGFYFDTTPWDEFTDYHMGNVVRPQVGGRNITNVVEIALTVGLMESLTGKLLFLQLDVDNMDYPDPSLIGWFFVNATGGGSDDRMSITQIPSMDLDFSWGVQADIDLDLTLGIVGGGKWPSIVSEFYMRWGLGDGVDNSSLEPLDNHYRIPYIAFKNVGLNLGSFFSDFLGPIVGVIQEITEPLQPLVDILTAPIPVISDLAGEDITLIDIAGMFGVVDPAFIYALADLITLINSIPTDAGDIIIYFGDFAVGGDGTLDLTDENALSIIRGSGSSASLSQVIRDNFGDDFGDLADKIDNFDFGSTMDDALSGSSASAATKSFASSTTKEGGGWSFPIFTDAGQIFGLLLGRDADIIVYDMPKFTFDFTYSQFFPIWDGLGAEITGSIGVIIDLSFGYDTYGIRQFAEGGFKHPLDLLKGFYVGDLDLDTGADIPEVTVYGSLTGAAVLNIVVAKVGVGGGVYATVDFNLNDPDGDGKVRIEEIWGNILNGFKQLGIPLGLICIFDVSGKVTARLFAFVELLWGLWEKTWYFGPSIPLIEFSYSCPKDPILAKVNENTGELRLNMGKFAKDRLYGDLTDGNEEFHVELKSGNTVEVWAKIGGKVIDKQEYSGVTKIMAGGGEGNDIIDLSGVTSSGITAELTGDSGNDVLIAGDGNAILEGGLGDDILVGGGGNDELYGEKGNDFLIGNGGNDFLDGDEGDDALNGDAKQPYDGSNPFTLRGTAGTDTLLGGDGDDFLAGGPYQDVIRGGYGKDNIWGDGTIEFESAVSWNYKLILNGDGIPDIQNETTNVGDDHITGDEDADIIFGGGGNDIISGGGAPDILYGDDGNDNIWCDSSFRFKDNALKMNGNTPIPKFPLYGTAAGDEAHGGAGSDQIFGEDGNDVLYGDGGDDFLYGNRSADVIYGGDQNDELYGGTGNDRMFGNDGNDLVKGEADNDIMFGDDGEVEIVSGQLTLNLEFIKTINPGTDGNDEMDGNVGDDILLGGPGTDTINGSTGNDIIIGDNGELDFTFESSIGGSLIDYFKSTDPGVGAQDYLYGGEGDDIIIGGRGGDSIYGDADAPGLDGEDIAIGDNGEVLFVHDVDNKTSRVEYIRTTDTDNSTGGDDYIDGSENADIILGGVGDDDLIGGLGDDVIVGDSGELDYDTGDGNVLTLDLIRTTDNILPSPGGVDDISGGEGNDTVLGGKAGDFIYGDDTLGGSPVSDPGDDVLLGDQGELVYENGLIARIETTALSASDGGNDTIEGNEEDDIIIGGVKGDFLDGATGEDIIIGDEGQLKYNLASGAGGDDDPTTLDLVTSKSPDLGSGDTIEGDEASDIIIGGSGGDDITGDEDDDFIMGDNAKVTMPGGVVDLIETIDPTYGSNDTIEGNDGDDIIIGGTLGDEIWGNNGDDVILGDCGDIIMPDEVIEVIETTYPATGANDIIEGNNDDDIILGGPAGDYIWGHDGEDVIVGDCGKITLPGRIIDFIETTDPAIGGSDIIEGNLESDIILGGADGDEIWGNEGGDVILGDNGNITMPGAVIDLIKTTDPAIGGSDIIEGNSGDDLILGGTAGDDIWGHDGDDVILGDNGMITMPDEVIDLIETTDPAIGGSDTIEGNEGDDLIFGGTAGDDIWGHVGDDVILGDNGKITMPDEVIYQIETTDPAIGGSDTIEGNDGADLILGGTAGDDIWGHEVEDVIIGDNGFLNFIYDGDASSLDIIATTDPAIGGGDTIEGNDGDDIILGGADGDDIWGHAGEDIILGDNGNITQPGAIIYIIKTTDPAIGGIDTIEGNEDDDIIIGGPFGDHLEGNAGLDKILGDNGLFDYVYVPIDGATLDPSTLDLVTVTDPNDGGADTVLCGSENDLAFGGTDSDTMYGHEGNDLMFGDHGKVERKLGMLLDLSTLPVPTFIFTCIFTAASDGGDDDLMHGNEGDDILLGQQGDDDMFGDEDDDDMIGGHNVVGGIDELDPIFDINDIMDGGSGDDVMTGDNAIVDRRTDTVSPRIRALDGDTLYDENDNADVTGTHQPNPSGARGRDITMLDHNDFPTSFTFGVDYMAGGPDEDVMFGELGNDLMQGDASVAETVSPTDPSVEGVDDDDDYMEGNGGDDLIFGNWGQDDIVGGSSDLFGLTSPSLRPDGKDTIFGGAGTRIARYDPGDESDDGHAADSDYILGDNANIFRIVGTNGVATGQFLTFTYDDYGTVTIIPRAVLLLDYTPGGSSSDIGDDDLIHGEAGDDLIHGMVGNDVLFGEGQDDDLYGQTGHDRLYGGNGQDGMLGDDGRIRTSRNGQTETLYGLTKAFKEKKIKIPGPFVGAWVDIEDRLKKVADIAAFEFGGNDIMYGGLGNDWMHAGAGDDAMLGAEALIAFYNSNPITNTTPLPYDPVTQKISFYDAENPRTKIAGFFLNFEAVDGIGNKIFDGKDRMFGDNGNDWIVGGTENDRHFGGLGDDVINADDNHDSQGGLNNEPDIPEFADRDFSFGGAGRDVLIFNTGGDRSYDWIGEYNSYIAPYAPFGNPEVLRLISPHCVKFLMALGEACGADQSFVESDGELGLADQHDPRWGDQHGAPRDPQAGNLPGVHRDTMGEPEDDR